MAAAKQWEARKSDFPDCPILGKPYNAEKYNELYKQFDRVNQHFDQNQRIIAHSRMIVEEVSNIIERNSEWQAKADSKIRVRTEFNGDKTIFKTDIIYDGTEYYDPEKKNITNVVGSKGFFKKYERTYKIENNEVRINVRIEI